MYQDIKLRYKYNIGKNKNYDGFSRIFIELANEKSYDRRAAKGRGENDMDTDLVEREAPMRNEPRDEHPDYTEQEWVDWEAELQEELNWVGTRKGGKGNGKGARENGKGKGKAGKGSGGACFLVRGARPCQGRLQNTCGLEI